MIAQTAAIGLVFPILEAIVFTGIRFLTRCLDQGSCCPCDKKNTKATSIQKFEAIYSGPLFFVHYRLAGLVNLVFIAFFFGPGMPLMFPIALAGLMFNLFTERIRMAYSYRKPPMYENSLNEKTLYALGYAPLLYFVMSAWLFSNQQVFKNVVPQILDNYLYPLNEHQFGDLLTQATPGTPFVVGAILYIIWRLMKCCGSRLCCKGDETEVTLENMVVIEGLDPFFASMKSGDREFWFREEVVAQERIGMTRISKRNFENLVIAPTAKGKNRLRDVHNYDILTNPAYSDRFLYIPCSYPDRHEYTVSEYKDPFVKCYSTDICRLVVDLAYMPVDEGKNL